MNSIARLNKNGALTPRQLILELLDADGELMGRSRRLLAAGEVFGLSANQMRVALTRLVADGLLYKAQRGQYALSGAGAALREEIQRWRHLEDQLCEWRGDWCVLITANLALESSTRFRAQNRALRLRGMQRWRPGLWVRPNNIGGGLPALVADVSSLGLDSLAGSFVICETDSSCRDELIGLWDIEAMRKQYKHSLQRVEDALNRINQADQTAVLKETVVLGGEMIRSLLTDPLLPAAMLGCDTRARLMTMVRDYDAAGRLRWRSFMDKLYEV